MAGISILTCVMLVILVGIQFCICEVPLLFGYGTIPLYTNLLCMAIGGCIVAWFMLCKLLLRFIMGGEDLTSHQI